MNQHKTENLLKLPAEERVAYFVRKVVDLEKVWGLESEGWATAETSDGQVVIPFWPEKELAELCAVSEWKGYVPSEIALSIFTQKWLSGMEVDRILPAIFPTPNDKGVIVEPRQLKEMLASECDQY